MLDQEMKEQLRGVFGKLDSKVALVYDESTNENQPELISMLTDLAETSSLIEARPSGKTAGAPGFEILHTDKDTKSLVPTGIHFKGIPGGHEFTSLVLGILNADGKGKMPDDGLRARIQAIRGPVKIKTFMSLTCENCPEVVQALNQMALLHDNFEHEVIDGAYAQDEIDKLGIQGVPSIVVGDKMIHSGRIHFLDLMSGEFKQVAESREEFDRLFGSLVNGAPRTLDSPWNTWWMRPVFPYRLGLYSITCRPFRKADAMVLVSSSRSQKKLGPM